jgi:hypothetical protein
VWEKLSTDAGCKGYSMFVFLQNSFSVKANFMKREDVFSKVPLDLIVLNN